MSNMATVATAFGRFGTNRSIGESQFEDSEETASAFPATGRFMGVALKEFDSRLRSAKGRGSVGFPCDVIDFADTGVDWPQSEPMYISAQVRNMPKA